MGRGIQILRDHLSGRVLGKSTTRCILFLSSVPSPGPRSLAASTESQDSKSDRCVSESACRGWAGQRGLDGGGASEDGERLGRAEKLRQGRGK